MQPNPIDLLLTYFNRLMPLNDQEQAQVSHCFSIRAFKRREVIVSPGERCRYYMFVAQGCLRMYSDDSKGNRHIIKFAPEQTWMTDIDSFFHLAPSRLYIDALEHTTVVVAELDPLVHLFMSSKRVNNIFRVMAENELILLQRRHLETLSSTAEERYLSFCDTYPQLVNRISQAQIAAYLGVTPEFLSRMKRRLLQVNKDVFLT
ncbi:MAG: Crp/Fnr family transcriptional regulator [Bacteroidaceae bacterium]|nr:Crp/Fnr family transcriptional regulator [Bacteroidaceae bacterium]